MKIGTSLRFLFPTSPQTHELFRQMLAASPGQFVDRPLGAYETDVQARNLIEVAAAAQAAGLDALLVGDHHAVPASYANVFQPIPTLARLLPLTGAMLVGASRKRWPCCAHCWRASGSASAAAITVSTAFR
jgi:hypothetical protein